MAMLTTSANAAFISQDTNALIVRPVAAASVAIQVSTLVTTGAGGYRVPIVSSDPNAGWVAEGGEISPSDGLLTEINVGLKKLAGLTMVSNELIADANESAAPIIGHEISRNIAVQLDQAYFGNLTTNGPAGLKSLTTSTASAGGAWANADPFTEAAFTAEGLGATITSWVANPADGLLLSNLKGGNRIEPRTTPTRSNTGRPSHHWWNPIVYFTGRNSR